MTVSDVMKLPSMVGAEVVAGRGGLEHPVDSVNVLEYAYATELLKRFFEENTFDGNELLITAFSAVCDDVDAQCKNVMHYHSVGSAGIILYYVGIILPEIDQRLIDLCDELDFVLICMPRGQTDLRYSEAIREILFQVYREQQRDRFFVTTILSRLSALPAQKRSMDTLLRMLSEYLRLSIVLMERRRGMNTAAFWPRSLSGVLTEKIPELVERIGLDGELEVELGGGTAYLQRCPHLLDNSDMRLFVISYGSRTTPDMLWQCSECVRLFIQIWNKDRGRFVISELVRAIINDDPLQKDQLAKIFNVRVGDLKEMWLFMPLEEQQEVSELALRSCTDYFSAYSNPVLVSYYDDTLVAFTTGTPLTPAEADAFYSIDRLDGIAGSYDIVCCGHLSNSAEAHRAYVQSLANWKTARRIFPGVKFLKMEDISFAKICNDIIESREDLEQYLDVISQIKAANAELMPTLATYLLDTSSNMAETSRRLYVHLNTVKYRLKQVNELTGYSPVRMPGSYLLYIASALYRITGG